MKLTLIYNPNDPKLIEDSYSQAYRDQLFALMDRFDDVQLIHQSCSSSELTGDVVLFYDIHSMHDITIDGIYRHTAKKYTYLDDPHQPGCFGVHRRTQQQVRKRSQKERIQRVIQRGVDYIICPYPKAYFRYFGEFLGKDAAAMLVWFPVVSDDKRYHRNIPLKNRKPEVLANGSTHHLPHFYGYEFRKWAFKQDEITSVLHCMYEPSTQRGLDYPDLLYEYAGVLALCDTHIAPKYLEVPLAGCVCFAQYHELYERMGFRDREHCIYVTKANFKREIKAFKNDPESYQPIADAGNKLVRSKWTASHFADYIYEHAHGH